MRADRLSDLEALQKLKDIRNEAIGTKRVMFLKL